MQKKDDRLRELLGWEEEFGESMLSSLHFMAMYKYKRYAQFRGIDFLSHLINWLSGFNDLNDRQQAFDLFLRIIYVSKNEMDHFVELAYTDNVRVRLIERAAQRIGTPFPHLDSSRLVTSSREFRMLSRKTLFLGLSEGARIDVLRHRVNSHPQTQSQPLTNEQVFHTYDISEERAKSLQQALMKDTSEDAAKFETVVLLDDFTASGTSFIRGFDSTPTRIEGKIPRAIERFSGKEGSAYDLCDSSFELLIVFYVATESALRYLRASFGKAFPRLANRTKFAAVQSIRDQDCVLPGRVDCDGLNELICKYYDHNTFDVTFANGGTSDAKYGYGGCGTTVVLEENTPNNTLPIIWAGNVNRTALFPRTTRHRAPALEE